MCAAWVRIRCCKCHANSTSALHCLCLCRQQQRRAVFIPKPLCTAAAGPHLPLGQHPLHTNTALTLLLPLLHVQAAAAPSWPLFYPPFARQHLGHALPLLFTAPATTPHQLCSAPTSASANCAGSSSAELSSFLAPFARQLLGPGCRWASSTWGILEAVPLPPAAVGEAWQLLLAAALALEGQALMPGRCGCFVAC